ncbi:hypothetical protein [Actinomycetospora atypica]|uniref:Uncharacterized protein n=1 Tax=Actinomycetospora atypica TaxID=1290095 RepID=A0ABV9YUI7_9PSEU
MARPRHAMRVHPLRTKGVAVGIPVAAVVAFGAHSVLGVTPLSDQQDTSTSTAPEAAAPAQAYGLAQAPPPTALGLLAAPVDEPAAAGTTGSSPGSAPGSPAAPAARQTTTHRIVPPVETVAIPAAAPAKPSMMTFSGGGERASDPAPAAAPAPAPTQRAAAPESHDEAPQQEAPREESAPQQQSGGGGALLGLDLGVAKVSVLSFG